MSTDTTSRTESASHSSAAQGSTPPLLQPAHRGWSTALALGLLCGALFFYGINLGEFYRTENLRAIIAQGFLDSGNWIVPTLYGEPLLTKPPGMYAAIAAASAPVGHVTEWTARLPSALAATAVVFLFYWYVSRHLGRLAGLIVAAVTPCTFLFLDKGAAAEIDMLQVAWVAAAILCFFRAVEGHEAARAMEMKETDGVHWRLDDATGAAPGADATPKFGWWLAALLCVAGGVLTKWTAPVFFYATAIPFLFMRKQLRLLFSWQHIVSAIIGASICFGWVGAVLYQVGWETFYNTVYTEAAPRISHGHNLSTRQIVETATHPLKVLIANLPWAGFALLTLLPGFSRSFDPRGRRLLQAFHCWTWPSILVWTCLPDHTTRHNFPLFPGLTALAGMAWFGFIMHRLTPRTSQLHRWYAVLTMAAFGLGTVICGVGAFIMLPSAVWWLVVILLVFALWLVKEAVVAFRTERHGWLLATIVLTWVVLKLAFVHFHIPIRGGELRVNQVDLSFLGIDRPLVSPEPRAPRAKGTLLAQHVPPGETLYLRLAKDEGIMFYYGRPVIRVKNWEQLPRQDRPVYCIVDEREWKEFLRRGDWRAESELHLKDEQGDPMVLLGVVRDEPAIRAAQLNSERSRKYDSIE